MAARVGRTHLPLFSCPRVILSLPFHLVEVVGVVALDMTAIMALYTNVDVWKTWARSKDTYPILPCILNRV